MGCDIHPTFETLGDNGWELTFPIIHYSWDDYVRDKIMDGSAQTIFGTPDEAEAERKLIAYLWTLTDDELIAKGLKPPTEEGWGFTYLPRYVRDIKWDNGPQGWCTAAIKERHYEWFGYVSDGVRGYDGPFPVRGWPDDLCDMLRRYGPNDGYHSHNWLMVGEILADPGIDRFPEKKVWFERFIEHPDRTRMVFSFDS